MSLIADMNRIRPLPTVAREGRALVANTLVAVAVLGALWVFEIPLLLPGIVIAVMLVVLLARLAYRARRGDEPDPA